MQQVSFGSYINVSMQLEYVGYPIHGFFIQWANSFIIDEERKILMTVAIVRTQEGKIFLANPLGLSFHDPEAQSL
ncbi:hypothetical protein [Foetidibacter luteolus]|uniref:hypothetical protein n=1 Tax=Foetidibacter luteolus TaxID=2608880 RepID=UPI00129B69C2|nr:hypothetical protein [Foetidibacter luteolus]